MRPIEGMGLAVGLMLVASVSGADAQTSPGEYGGYPLGNTSEASSGINLVAPYAANPGGLPITSFNVPNSNYGANYVFPQANGSDPSYNTYGTRSGQPDSYYGANYVVPVPGGSSPGIYTFGPTSGQPASHYGSNYFVPLPGGRYTYTNGLNNNIPPGAIRTSRSGTLGTITPGVPPGGTAVRMNPNLSVPPSRVYFTPRLR